MEDVTILIASSCLALALLVYLMWRDATAGGWSEMSQAEKKKWREAESKRSQKIA